MKEDIQNLLFEEIKSSNLKGVTKASQIEVFEPKNIEFGDWTSNICMKLAANSEDNPRQIAEKLIKNLTKNDWITKIEIAGAGQLVDEDNAKKGEQTPEDGKVDSVQYIADALSSGKTTLIKNTVEMAKNAVVRLAMHEMLGNYVLILRKNPPLRQTDKRQSGGHNSRP